MRGSKEGAIEVNSGELKAAIADVKGLRWQKFAVVRAYNTVVEYLTLYLLRLQIVSSVNSTVVLQALNLAYISSISGVI
jgi:hypothetical protein